jgi:hypothetical protein
MFISKGAGRSAWNVEGSGPQRPNSCHQSSARACFSSSLAGPDTIFSNRRRFHDPISPKIVGKSKKIWRIFSISGVILFFPPFCFRSADTIHYDFFEPDWGLPEFNSLKKTFSSEKKFNFLPVESWNGRRWLVEVGWAAIFFCVSGGFLTFVPIEVPAETT